MRATHSDFRKGQRLFITMRDGERIVDKFVESKSGVLVLRQRGRVSLSQVRHASIKR